MNTRPLLSVLLITACGPSTTALEGSGPGKSEDALAAQVQAAVEDLELVGAAMAVAYADEPTTWTAAAGLAQRESMQAWEPHRSVRIGSTTKTFTAALIFLLEEEGLLAIDDPLDLWVPGYYDNRGVTLRHLLANTSGIASYNYVGSFDESAAWEPTQLVAWAVAQDPELHFEPGAQWEYSNTNFVLLGLVIEAATGNTYTGEVQARLLEPLGLADTYIAVSGDINPAIVDCYARDGTNMSGTSDPSFGWAAGAGVSTPSDLAHWAVALYGGDILAADTLERMLTPEQLPDGTVLESGLGVFIEDDGVDAIYGHTGGFSGFQTYMYFWRTDRIALVAMTNTRDTDLRDFAGYGWAVPLGFDYP